MAKKTKRTKRTKPKASEPPVSVTPDVNVRLELTGAVLEEPETVRRLAHRVVEMLADSARDDRLSGFVKDNLVCLVDGFVIERVTALIEEARAARKAVPRG